eukprot:1249415-Pleurochrysis_carterae.AAC.1
MVGRLNQWTVDRGIAVFHYEIDAFCKRVNNHCCVTAWRSTMTALKTVPKHVIAGPAALAGRAGACARRVAWARAWSPSWWRTSSERGAVALPRRPSLLKASALIGPER